jgi:hypothetical protein
MSEDTRRYMQTAAASTQTTVKQLLARLQSYQTFQPFLSFQAPYTPAAGSGAAQQGTSGGNSPRQRRTDRTLTSPQLWQMMNGLLDTSVSHLLRHSAEGHFIVTLQSTLGWEPTSTAPKVRTVIESRAPSIAGSRKDAAADAPHSRPHTTAGATPTTAVEDSSLLVERWAAEHPTARAADVAVQRDAWSAFEEKRRRDNCTFYLRAMQEQLDALQAEERGSAALTGAYHPGDSRLRPFISSHTPSTSEQLGDAPGAGHLLLEGSRNNAAVPEATRAAQSEAELKREADRQRALWLSFRDKQSVAAAVWAANSSKPLLQPSPNAPCIVTAYQESSDLHQWLHSSWPHRTHRHESAALRIQCAYRVYRARCEVQVMRYARWQCFAVGLAAEKEARRVWDVALQMQVDANKAVSSSSGGGGGSGNADSTMRALQFFIDKINAVVAKRRARKKVQQKQDAEIREYAAASIQRVYRGHRARVLVEELRHPEIVEARQRAVEKRAATVVQTSWRRHRQQHQWRRLRQAACALQRGFRCRAARRLLAERRRLAAMEEVAALRRFAVSRIEEWYSRHLARRSAFAAAHAGEIRLLQRVSRSYVVRKHLGVERRIAALRVAAAVVARRRRALLDTRAAVAMRARLTAEKAAHHHVLLCEDAAITIQRAWRRCLAAQSSDTTSEGEL